MSPAATGGLGLGQVHSLAWAPWGIFDVLGGRGLTVVTFLENIFLKGSDQKYFHKLEMFSCALNLQNSILEGSTLPPRDHPLSFIKWETHKRREVSDLPARKAAWHQGLRTCTLVLSLVPCAPSQFIWEAIRCLGRIRKSSHSYGQWAERHQLWVKNPRLQSKLSLSGRPGVNHSTFLILNFIICTMCIMIIILSDLGG